MNTENKKKPWDGKTQRRKGKRPRRRLMDLTLARGTDRRETKEDRRKEGNDVTTKQRGEKNKI